jgi:hypothetical protein
MELYNLHFEETKKLIEEESNKLFLDEEDLNADKSMFAPLKQKAQNVILSTYITEMANERLTQFNNLSNNEELKNKYKDELIIFLRKNLRRNI